MANVMDLLMDWKNVTAKNEDISKLYIAYQMFMMVSSILTPGTILLMILGSLYTAFPAIEPWTAFVVNLIPVVIMVVLCFVAKSDVQVLFYLEGKYYYVQINFGHIHVILGFQIFGFGRC